jgi:hypothetical protein
MYGNPKMTVFGDQKCLAIRLLRCVLRTMYNHPTQLDLVPNFLEKKLHAPPRPLQLMHLNFLAQTRLTKAVLPGMLARKCGQIINIRYRGSAKSSSFWHRKIVKLSN